MSRDELVPEIYQSHDLHHNFAKEFHQGISRKIFGSIILTDIVVEDEWI